MMYLAVAISHGAESTEHRPFSDDVRDCSARGKEECLHGANRQDGGTSQEIRASTVGGHNLTYAFSCSGENGLVSEGCSPESMGGEREITTTPPPNYDGISQALDGRMTCVPIRAATRFARSRSSRPCIRLVFSGRGDGNGCL